MKYIDSSLLFIKKRGLTMFKYIWKKEYADNKYLIDFLQDEKIKNRISANLLWYIRKATESKYGYYTLTIITIVAPVVSAIILNGPFEDEITKIGRASCRERV